MERTGMLPVGVQEEPEHKGKPYERHPLMLMIDRVKPVPDGPQGFHRFLIMAPFVRSLSAGTRFGHNPIPDYGCDRQCQSQVEPARRQRECGEQHHQQRPDDPLHGSAGHIELLLLRPPVPLIPPSSTSEAARCNLVGIAPPASVRVRPKHVRACTSEAVESCPSSGRQVMTDNPRRANLW